MKVLRSFFIPLFFLIVLCAPAVAQKENKVTFLSERSTLEEIQNWLINVMTGKSGHRLTETKTVKDAMKIGKDEQKVVNTRISDVKFEGCQMNYTVESSTEATQQTSSIFGTQGMPMGASRERTKVSFKLSDIDTNEISFKEIGEEGVMSVIALRTVDYKRVIKLNAKDTGPLTVSVASFMVSSQVAEETKNALVRAVDLCKAQ